MAKILNPGGGTDMSGSVSGMTYSRWRGLRTVRRKAVPVRRFRDVQPNKRATMGYFSRKWGQRTSAERALWRNWAATHPQPDGFGGTFLMSGINSYIQFNLVHHTAFPAAAELTVPPIGPLLVAMGVLTAAVGALSGDIDLTWTLQGTGLATDTIQVQVSSGYVGAGRLDAFEGYHDIASVAGNLLLVSVTGLQGGLWYSTRVRYIQADGQTSAWVYAIQMAKV